MTTQQLSTVDRIAMLVGGGLIIIGTAVLGFLNVITNSPHMEVVEDGTVVAEPLISPDLRAYIILLGLLVFLLYGLYKLANSYTSEVGSEPTPT